MFNTEITTSSAFEALKNQTEIDRELEKSIRNEASKWLETLRPGCHSPFSFEKYNLLRCNRYFKNYHYQTRPLLDEFDNGNFLATLELLRNKTLKFYLEEVSRHQKQRTRMQAHYLSWRTQNEFIMACGETVFAVIIEEVYTDIYFFIIFDGTPDVFHTEQITFVLRFVRLGSDNQWIVKERFQKLCGFVTTYTKLAT
ncbi:uncharacterized protein LOC136081126 [Hydra vulgaris]|uniref:Uncharacterized protein LOC136081126 n=1 Tax=Hydra vulgaris TaxID=6087 RepID=A0ABM4BZ17_HYDVU